MPAAGVWIRLKAFMLDYIWIFFYLLFVFVLSTLIVPDIQMLFAGSSGAAQLTGFFLVTFPVSLYFAVFDSRWCSGTFGKKKMKVRVVDRRGKEIGFVRSLVRVIFKFAPWELSHFLVYRLAEVGEGRVPLHLTVIGGIVYGLMILYILTAVASKEKRTLYDLLSGAKVIRTS